MLVPLHRSSRPAEWSLRRGGTIHTCATPRATRRGATRSDEERSGAEARSGEERARARCLGELVERGGVEAVLAHVRGEPARRLARHLVPHRERRAVRAVVVDVVDVVRPDREVRPGERGAARERERRDARRVERQLARLKVALVAHLVVPGARGRDVRSSLTMIGEKEPPPGAVLLVVTRGPSSRCSM